jgi:hypothetical protein
MPKTEIHPSSISQSTEDNRKKLAQCEPLREADTHRFPFPTRAFPIFERPMIGFEETETEISVSSFDVFRSSNA